jgi:hypothetical protein
MANKKTTERELAKMKFLYDNKTQKQIAFELNIAEKTVGTWAKEDKWEDERRIMKLSNRQYANQTTKFIGNWFFEIDNRIQYPDLPKGLPQSKESDAIVKLVATRNKLLNDMTPPQVYQNTKKFIEFVKRKDLATAQAVTAYFEEFMKDIIETYEADTE